MATAIRPKRGRLYRILKSLKVCVHCKCDKSEHELPPNQAGSVYERLGIKPPANMPISSSRDDAPGSVSHGYAWVPPGLTRKKGADMLTLEAACIIEITLGERTYWHHTNVSVVNTGADTLTLDNLYDASRARLLTVTCPWRNIFFLENIYFCGKFFIACYHFSYNMHLRCVGNFCSIFCNELGQITFCVMHHVRHVPHRGERP
ncbi:hypothetical protein Y032_0022g579 [Ancylostoma ceylanicum]|uniref:PET domain-containing protein n=1 Tax=Ancylostoma ceylanicum TaxID=53326 RepID=A0A016UYR8_9BILA|nr:hypothetical protein Y032_0022g579 [Ancylostoma ceylanicum]